MSEDIEQAVKEIEAALQLLGAALSLNKDAALEALTSLQARLSEAERRYDAMTRGHEVLVERLQAEKRRMEEALRRTEGLLRSTALSVENVVEYALGEVHAALAAPNNEEGSDTP